MAEEAWRTKIEIKKLSTEEARLEELEFLRSLVRKNMPSHQVALLLAEHQAAKLPRPPPYHSWSFATDPLQRYTEPVEPGQRPQQSKEPRQQLCQAGAPVHTQAPFIAQNPNRPNASRKHLPTSLGISSLPQKTCLRSLCSKIHGSIKLYSGPMPRMDCFVLDVELKATVPRRALVSPFLRGNNYTFV